MSTLRDELADSVLSATDERHRMTINGDYGPIDERPYIDRILAAVADALTSDEAVDAMLYRSYGWADYDEGTTYLDLPEDEKADIRDMGRNEIGAALEAAGIAKGKGDE